MPKLINNGLKWRCTGDFVARQCLQYRGVIPVCADPSLGSPDGAILRAALNVVSVAGIYDAFKLKTSYAGGQSNIAHLHEAPDHDLEATQPMVGLSTHMLRLDATQWDNIKVVWGMVEFMGVQVMGRASASGQVSLQNGALPAAVVCLGFKNEKSCVLLDPPWAGQGTAR